MEHFAHIRPFIDSEVADAVAALLADADFVRAIRLLRFQRLPKALDGLLLPLTHRALQRQLQDVHTVDAFQQRMSGYLDYMVASTVDTLSFSGFEALCPDENYLFISNHRDITLDPAFINYALFHRWQRSLRIAIGDNLLSDSFVSPLMRLNKSFLVKRSATAPRKLLANLQELSAYIYFCLKQDKHSVWLAQSAGRAKDGADKTDAAIIKMLAMNIAQGVEFSSYINKLNIVPVSISYEYDPCDALKAQELYTLATTGQYIKSENEDFISMGKGILGYKGNVHIGFGTPLEGEYPNPAAVAQQLDRQIISNYQLHASNILAFELLLSELPAHLAANYSKKEKQVFMERYRALPLHLRDHWLAMYANPVLSKIALANA